MTIALVLVAAVLLDAWLGEPRRGHPLVAFGALAGGIERRLWRDARGAGIAAWVLAVLPLTGLAWWLERLAGDVSPWLAQALDTLLLYAALGLRSLGEHARAVAAALGAGDLAAARVAVGRIVGRDVAALDATGVARAATESVLENGHDAVFGALFWCALLGAPGVVLFRLANTLDAMWGHRTPRLARFGWCAARIDDVLGYVPARLAAFGYALAGHFDGALAAWRHQARAWPSPNAGPVMAAGAGALGLELGGGARYHGAWVERPPLGGGAAPGGADILRALALVRRGVALWLAAAGLITLGGWLIHA